MKWKTDDARWRKARLTWTDERLAHQELSTSFATPAEFEGREGAGTWSLVVELVGPAASDRTQDVRIQFLMNNAPHEWLESGQRFALIPPMGEGIVL